jgi:hypothetical protein
MSRTTGLSPNIRAWRIEQLINDMAEGGKSDEELAAEYDVENQSIRVFRLRHKADIQAKKVDLSSRFSHIWSTKVWNRLRLLTLRLEEIEHQIELLHDHAERETEMIRNVDPEACQVPVNGSELRAYEKEQRALTREIADQTGQLPQRSSVEVNLTKNPITNFDTIAVDESGNWHAVVSQ